MRDRVTEYVESLETLFLGFTHGTRSLCRKNNLTAVQFLVLQWAMGEQPATMTALAGFLGVRPQSVTPVIDSLVERGWIHRKPSPTDRRQTLLELSPETVRLMAAYRSAHMNRLKRSLRKLPPESLAHATAVIRETERALADSIERTPKLP